MSIDPHAHNKTKESERLNASLMASLDILDYLGSVRRGASLAELHRSLGLNKSRVIRLCGTLCLRGYLTYLEEEGAYTLGPRLMALGKVFEEGMSALAVIRPVLAEIEQELGETVSFHVLRGKTRLCLCAVESRQQVRYIMNEGSTGDAPFGSIWKVFMAYGPEDLLREIYDHAPYIPETPFSIVTREELEGAVRQTQAQGYFLSDSDHDVGSVGIAFPVFSAEGRLRGVLCLSGVTDRVKNMSFAEKALPLLKKQADRLGRLLEGIPLSV